MPKIAVIIPAFNVEGFLERAVRSVYSTHYPSIEVLIVDDGSEDATAAVAATMCEAYPGQCRLLHHPDRSNRGVSASRNLGLGASESEWVAFLDGDDFYLANRFTAFQECLARGEAFDAIYEMSEIRIGESGRAPTPASMDRFGIGERLTGEGLLRALLEGRCWSSGAITLRRSLLEWTGYFDAAKRIAEDCDLWFRVAAAGRVLAGSLEAPAAVYWRHAGNTYHYQPEHRVAMVVAMLDGWQWARGSGVRREILATFESCVPDYVFRSIVALREAGRPELAWSIVRMIFQSRSRGCLFHRRFLRQLFAMLRGRTVGHGDAEAKRISP